MQAEKEYEDPDDHPKLTKANNAAIFKFIDDFPEQLGCLTRTVGWPLSYVICEDMVVPAVAEDPMFGNIIWDEIVQHASHASVHYLTDNKQVFEILCDSITEFEEVKVWIKRFARVKDG